MYWDQNTGAEVSQFLRFGYMNCGKLVFKVLVYVKMRQGFSGKSFMHDYLDIAALSAVISLAFWRESL